MPKPYPRQFRDDVVARADNAKVRKDGPMDTILDLINENNSAVSDGHHCKEYAC